MGINKYSEVGVMRYMVFQSLNTDTNSHTTTHTHTNTNAHTHTNTHNHSHKHTHKIPVFLLQLNTKEAIFSFLPSSTATL
jgi:ABC-type Zn2+ transport system substrate-binding protein/surface adhesin